MASIDERIVAMKFDNRQFEDGVAQTISSLGKLSASLSQIGSVTGFADIEKEAAKVTLDAPMSALDKLKARFGLLGDDASEGMGGIDKAGSKVTLDAPMSALDRLKARLGLVGSDAEDGFADIEKSGSKVTLDGPMSALDRLKARLRLTGDDAADGMADLEKAGDRVELSGPIRALDRVQAKTGEIGGNASAGFSEINTAADRVSFDGMAAGIDNISSKLSVMGAIGFTAINEITKSLLSLGKKTVTGLLDPILQGGKDRAIKIEQAKFQFRGLGQDVEKSMDSALAAVKGTAYGLDAAASVAAQFGATGMEAGDEMTGALRGVAGMSAMTGRSFEEIGQIFTTVAGEGKLSTMRMQQFATRGVNVAAQLAKQMGVSENEVRRMVRDGEISFKQFAKYMDGAFGEHATKANETYTGSLANVKAALSRLGASIQVPRLEAMRKIFNALTDVIDNFAEALEPAIDRFAEFSEIGSDRIVKFLEALNFDRLTKALPFVIKGVENVFAALLSIMKPVGQAFREIFPKKSAEELASLTKGFQDFTAVLKVGPEKAEALKRTFKGFFAVIHIGTSIIGEIIKMFGNLLGAAGEGSGGILNFTGSIGDFLVAVDKALTDGGLLTNFFEILTGALKAPIEVLSALTEGIFGLFSGADGSKLDKFSKSLSDLSLNLEPVEKALGKFKEAWQGFLRFLEPIADKIKEAFAAIGDGIAHAFSPENYDRTLEAIKTGFIGGIFLSIRKAMGEGINVEVGGIKGLSDMFKALTGNLIAMQNNLKANTLFKIAAAIGLLAVGVLILSKIDAEDLAKGLLAVAIGLSQLVGAMVLLGKATGGSKFAVGTLPVLATGLVFVAGAIVLLAGAVAIFSLLSWEDLVKGLIGVAGALIAVDQGTKYLSGKHLIGVGLALIPLAVGMNILALAVRQLGTLSWEQLAKGLLGMGVALVVIGEAIRYIPSDDLIRIGIGLTAVGFALNIIAAAVLTFGSMDLLTIGKGILGIGVSLVVLGKALLFIPPNLAAQAAALILVSIALSGIAGAVAILGNLDILTLVKGIAALGAVLVVLGYGLMGMTKTLPGSQALLAAAVALSIIAPVLGFLGSLKISTIVKGLGAIAAVLGVLALAGLFAAVPLKLLALALLPLAGVMALVSASAYLFAKSLVLMGTDGAKGVGVLIAAMGAFMLALPTMVINFMKGLVSILAEMAKVAPKIVDSLAKILISMINVVILAAPKLGEAIIVLLSQFIRVIDEKAPEIIIAGIKLLVTFLSGVADNIGKVTTLGIKIIVEFIRSLTAGMPRLIVAGVKLLVTFLSGITQNVHKIVTAVSRVIVTFLGAVASHTRDILDAGFAIIIEFVRGMGRGIYRLIRAGVGTIKKIMQGIGEAVPELVEKGVWLAGKLINAVAQGLVGLVDVGFRAIIDFLNALARSIREHAPDLRQAGWNLVSAIISGMTFGLSDRFGDFLKEFRKKVGDLPKWAKKILGIKSPSTVFVEIGMQTMAGLTKGIVDNASGSERAMETSGNKVVTMAKRTMGNLGGLLDGVMDLDPVIAPILDLSAVHKEADKLAYLSDIKPIVAAASLDQASAISLEKTALDTAQAAEVAQAGPSFQFEQNNYSPEALSDVEIYRKTNNQLSQVKDALGLAT